MMGALDFLRGWLPPKSLPTSAFAREGGPRDCLRARELFEEEKRCLEAMAL